MTTWRLHPTDSSPAPTFSFGLKAGTLSTAPVDLIVLKADGADPRDHPAKASP